MRSIACRRVTGPLKSTLVVRASASSPDNCVASLLSLGEPVTARSKSRFTSTPNALTSVARLACLRVWTVNASNIFESMLRIEDGSTELSTTFRPNRRS